MRQAVQQEGSYRGYSQRLQEAWGRLAQQPNDAERLVTAIGYRMIQFRLVGIASRPYPELVRRAVELGLWSREYAASLVSVLPAPYQSGEARAVEGLRAWLEQGDEAPARAAARPLQRLGSQPSHPSLMKQSESDTLERILAGEARQNDHWQLVLAFNSLPDDELPRVLTVARDLEVGNVHRANLLAGLAQREAAPVQEAFQSVREALRQQEALAQVIKALEKLCPLLSPEQLDELVDVAQQIHERPYSIEALTALVAHLQPQAREDALHFALGSLMMVHSGDRSVPRLLGRLLPLLRGDLLRQGVEILLGYSQQEESSLFVKLDLLVEIVPKLPPEVRPKVIEHMRHAALVRSHAEAIRIVLQETPSEEHAAILEEALTLPVERDTSTLFTDEHRARSHHPVAPKTLLRMIPYLQGAHRQRAIDAAYATTLRLEDVGGGFEYIYSPIAEVVAELAPYLEGERLHEALRRGVQGALRLPEFHHLDSRPRKDALSALAEYLPADLLQPLLDRAKQPHSILQGDLLKNLIDYVPSEQRKEHLRYVLNQRLTDDRDPQSRQFWLAGRLEEVAPYLEGDLLQEALDITLGLSPRFHGSHSRAGALVALAPSLTPEMLLHAFDKLDALRAEGADAQGYYEALALLAAYCTTPELIARARAAIEQLEAQWQRIAPLAALVPRLPAEERPAAIDSLLDIMSETRLLIRRNYRDRHYPTPIATIAPYLGEAQRQRAMAIILAQENAEVRADALLDMLPDHPDLPAIREEAMRAIFQASTVEREQKLAALMPYLTDEQRDHVLDRILSKPDEIGIRNHLAGVAAHLTQDGMARLLDFSLGTRDAHHTNNLVQRLAPNLRGENLRRVVDFLMATRYDDDFGMDPLSGPLAKRTAQMRGNQQRSYYRGKLFTAIIPFLEPSMLGSVRESILEMNDALGRATALATFVQHHVQDEAQAAPLLDVALRAAMEIPNEKEQLEALDTFEWNMTTTATALERFQQIEQPLRRARLLARLLPRATEPEPVIAAIRAALFEVLRTDDDAPRPRMWDMLADARLVTPPILPEEQLREIVRLMKAIYEEWRWL